MEIDMNTIIIVVIVISLFVLLYVVSMIKRNKEPKYTDVQFKEALQTLEKPIDKKVTQQKKVEKKIKKEEVKEGLDDKFRSLKPFKPVQLKLTDLKTWRAKWNDKFKSHRTVLINMELLNGMNRLFLAVEKEGGFQYRKKQYLLDDESKYYIIEAKLYAYDFHEGFALPIKRKIPVPSIRESIKNSVSEVEYSTNPETLQNFMVAKIAEGIMKGAEIDAWMKQIRILLVVVGIVALLHFLLYLQKSGALAQLQNVV